MTAVFAILGGVAALAAVGAWVVVAITMIGVIQLAPKGRRAATFTRLGWWQFGAIEAELGPAVRPLTRRYLLAFAVFFGAILLLALLAVLGTATQST